MVLGTWKSALNDHQRIIFVIKDVPRILFSKIRVQRASNFDKGQKITRVERAVSQILIKLEVMALETLNLAWNSSHSILFMIEQAPRFFFTN